MARARPITFNKKMATPETSTVNPIVVDTEGTTKQPAAAKKAEKLFTWSDEDDTSDEDDRKDKPTPPVKTIKKKRQKMTQVTRRVQTGESHHQ